MRQVCIDRRGFDVPDAARWLAQDLSGWWYWYDKKPVRGRTIWGGLALDYNCVTNTSVKDWTEELYELVEEED